MKDVEKGHKSAVEEVSDTEAQDVDKGHKSAVEEVSDTEALLPRTITEAVEDENEKWYFKSAVLILLVVQNAGAVVLMRYTRSLSEENSFSTQTAVIMQEVIKLCVCTILMIRDGNLSSISENPLEALKSSIPAILYLVQNNLQYIAVGMLDAATYTVSYQTKTIWSGILTVVILGRRLDAYKWMGLTALFAGVGLVQVSNLRGYGDGLQGTQRERLVGLAVIVTAAAVSSCAGVYFEKILKGSTISLWARNFQLAGFSLVAALFPLLVIGDDSTYITSRGFFFGYTPMTWACIVTNAGGGLLVGTVIKYADAVTKDVAIGASIVLSSITSIYLFDFELSFLFCIGVFLVIVAVLAYGGNFPQRNISTSCSGAALVTLAVCLLLWMTRTSSEKSMSSNLDLLDYNNTNSRDTVGVMLLPSQSSNLESMNANARRDDRSNCSKVNNVKASDVIFITHNRLGSAIHRGYNMAKHLGAQAMSCKSVLDKKIKGDTIYVHVKTPCNELLVRTNASSSKHIYDTIDKSINDNQVEILKYFHGFILSHDTRFRHFCPPGQNRVCAVIPHQYNLPCNASQDLPLFHSNKSDIYKGDVQYTEGSTLLVDRQVEMWGIVGYGFCSNGEVNGQRGKSLNEYVKNSKDTKLRCEGSKESPCAFFNDSSVVIVLSHPIVIKGNYSGCFETNSCENKPYERLMNPVMMNIPVVIEDFSDSFRSLMPEASPFMCKFPVASACVTNLMDGYRTGRLNDAYYNLKARIISETSVPIIIQKYKAMFTAIESLPCR